MLIKVVDKTIFKSFSIKFTSDEQFKMSINETIKFNFGSILDIPFNKLDYSQSVGLNRLSDLNLEQQSILLCRSNLPEHSSDDTNISNHHSEQFGRIFERNKTKCCGVINQHKRKVKGEKIISLDMTINLKQKGQSYTWRETLPAMYQPI